MNIEMLTKIANTVRGLSIDGVEKANSGHPGLPMGMADVGTVLFNEILKFNPQNPNWFNRDRFVLSGGHGSMLIYSLLHLYGYDVSLDDLKQFRQWGSITPGHPEYRETPGIETTTGPLGQGLSNAVGMVLAESILAASYNKEGFPVVDHFTYAMAGDGDLQEGVSHEACAFAGHNKLGKLIVFYDSNDITIDGETGLSFSDDTEKRFEAYHWDVQKINGHDYDEIRQAIQKAQTITNKPSLIICRTIIGYGSPNKAGKEEVHGAPLGTEEVRLTKENLGISQEPFFIPDEVIEVTRMGIDKGKIEEEKWQTLFDAYRNEFGELATELEDAINNKLPDLKLPEFEAGSSMATRASSGKIIEKLASQIPTLIGGSADLTPSNKTKAASQNPYSPENKSGKYIHYGVREFGMGGIMNGLALHGGVIPYGGTFFVFSDYMRSAIRMAALMGIRVIYVFTHDSIGLGEDGPTHQPVEHLAALRVIPNLVNLRPMDANETAEAWKIALERTDGPTSLMLTRQNLITVDRKTGDFADSTKTKKGGYVLTEDKDFEVILIGTGSEVEIALDAKEILNNNGIKVRVVSMPSTELFDQQTQKYKDSVLPAEKTKRVAVEAGVSQLWYKYVGFEGKIIGIDRFGASAPYKTLYKKIGLTAENVAKTAKALVNKK